MLRNCVPYVQHLPICIYTLHYFKNTVLSTFYMHPSSYVINCIGEFIIFNNNDTHIFQLRQSLHMSIKPHCKSKFDCLLSSPDLDVSLTMYSGSRFQIDTTPLQTFFVTSRLKGVV